MERIAARKLARDLKRRNVLPPNQRGYRAGKITWEFVAIFAYDVHEGFQRKKQTLAVAVDLDDAYTRVQFKLLMELVQYGVSLTLTKWLAAALQERKVAMRLGNCISTCQQLTMGLPQTYPRPTPAPSPLQCLHKGTVGSEQQWFKPGVCSRRRRAYLQDSQ